MGLRPLSFAAIETRAKRKERLTMYCSTKSDAVFVHEDGGRIIRVFSFNGSVESAYMSGNDKVVITYSAGHPKAGPRSRYTAIYEISSGRKILAR